MDPLSQIVLAIVIQWIVDPAALDPEVASQVEVVKVDAVGEDVGAKICVGPVRWGAWLDPTHICPLRVCCVIRWTPSGPFLPDIPSIACYDMPVEAGEPGAASCFRVSN